MDYIYYLRVLGHKTQQKGLHGDEKLANTLKGSY